MKAGPSTPKRVHFLHGLGWLLEFWHFRHLLDQSVFPDMRSFRMGGIGAVGSARYADWNQRSPNSAPRAATMRQCGSWSPMFGRSSEAARIVSLGMAMSASYGAALNMNLGENGRAAV